MIRLLQFVWCMNFLSPQVTFDSVPESHVPETFVVLHHRSRAVFRNFQQLHVRWLHRIDLHSVINHFAGCREVEIHFDQFLTNCRLFIGVREVTEIVPVDQQDIFAVSDSWRGFRSIS